MLNPLQAQELKEIEQEETQRFKVTDINSLNWVLRKLSVLEAKKKEINELADAEIERIENFRKQELENLQRSEDFFLGLINEYAQRRRAEDPKFKTEKTPYGSIGFRKQQPKWIYDEEKVVAYLNDNELYDFVRVKEEPKKAEIKKHFKVLDDGRVIDPDGQEVEGITVEFLPDALDVKVEV